MADQQRQLTAGQIKAIVKSGQLPPSTVRELMRAPIGKIQTVQVHVGTTTVNLTATTLPQSGAAQ